MFCTENVFKALDYGYTLIRLYVIFFPPILKHVGKSEWGPRYEIDKVVVIDQHTLRRMTAYIEYVASIIYESLLDKFG
jgi:hypothetical protein